MGQDQILKNLSQQNLKCDSWLHMFSVSWLLKKQKEEKKDWLKKHEKLSWKIVNKLEKHINENIYEHPYTMQIERISVSDSLLSFLG